MVSWELTKFKVEKTNKSTLNFETEIVIPEIYKDITVIYDDKQLIVWGSELKQDYGLSGCLYPWGAPAGVSSGSRPSLSG